MHHFFIPPEHIRGEEVVFPEGQAHQISRVLRMSAGGEVQVLDNQGWAYRVMLTGVDRQKVVGKIQSRFPAPDEPPLQLTLYQSFIKRDKFEWVLQKGTELGVHRFVPLITRHSQVQTARIKPAKRQRWQAILTEAAEQCHRGRLPELAAVVSFTGMLPGLSQFDRVFLATPDPAARPFKEVLDADPPPRTAALLIGPEGGWAGDEVGACLDNAAIPISLGPRILRTETAALAATTIIMHHSFTSHKSQVTSHN